LKRYNLKDGLGPIPKQTTERESSQRTASYQPTQADRQAQAKASGPVEIPKDLAGLSVKELKNIMDAIGVSKDDCFEKADLIRRIEEYKEQKKQSKRPQSGARPGSKGAGARSGYAPSSAGDTGTAFTPSGKDFSCMPEAKAVCFKITSVGNSEVGKSCLIKRYCEGRFVKRYISTIGVDYGVKKLTVKDVDISINFFDLSGNEDYKQIRTEFYEDSNGVMMVYDVDNKDSFASLVHWEEEMKRFGVDVSRIKVVVCGNKCDSPGREVNLKQALEWCKKRGY
jgi:DnaJ homolog subfamily C member 27